MPKGEGIWKSTHCSWMKGTLSDLLVDLGATTMMSESIE